MGIKLGIILTAGDPRSAAELAALAEEYGWDGVFTWDGVALGSMDTYDPWVTMAAMAMRTDRIRLGAIVTPPARRRPWKLAREAMSLDRLSNGAADPAGGPRGARRRGLRQRRRADRGAGPRGAP